MKKIVIKPDPQYRMRNPNLPDAYIFDMDGTLSLLGGRSPYDTKYCDQDPVNLPVLLIQRTLAQQYPVIIVSGRKNRCRPQTEKWLLKHDVFYQELYMRKDHDNRSDALVKAEIFRDFIAPRFNILGVFEDRTRVVEMWRWLGLLCFQVQDGNY